MEKLKKEMEDKSSELILYADINTSIRIISVPDAIALVNQHQDKKQQKIDKAIANCEENIDELQRQVDFCSILDTEMWKGELRKWQEHLSILKEEVTNEDK